MFQACYLNSERSSSVGQPSIRLLPDCLEHRVEADAVDRTFEPARLTADRAGSICKPPDQVILLSEFYLRKDSNGIVLLRNSSSSTDSVGGRLQVRATGDLGR